MKKIHELTPQQALLAEKHIGLVYRFLQHNHLKEDDYYDILIFGYLQAVQEYDENPFLANYSFSTIAWRRMQTTLNDHFYSENLAKNRPHTVSLHLPLDELDQLLPDIDFNQAAQNRDAILAEWSERYDAKSAAEE